MSNNERNDQQPVAVLEGVGRDFLIGGRSFSALADVDLCLAAGERVAIVGRSGSGKTTLLNMLTGIDRPSRGVVRVAGTDLARLDESALATFRGRHIGVVFQFFQLIPTLSVRENVLLAMELVGAIDPAGRETRADALLAKVGLAARADQLPGALSGGEQQRAAIARALANDPSLVVADEPTGNLDSQTAAGVVEVLRSLARDGKAVVVVTHDPSVAAGCDRVLRLSDGRVEGAR